MIMLLLQRLQFEDAQNMTNKTTVMYINTILNALFIHFFSLSLFFCFESIKIVRFLRFNIAQKYSLN